MLAVELESVEVVDKRAAARRLLERELRRVADRPAAVADTAADHKPRVVVAGKQVVAADRRAVVVGERSNRAAVADRQAVVACRKVGDMQVAAAVDNQAAHNQRGNLALVDIVRAAAESQAQEKPAQAVAQGECSAETDQIWPYHPSLENRGEQAESSFARTFIPA